MTVLVAGEALVDFLPDRRGPLADVESFERRAGGAPANVAVGLARLGAAPRLWTRVGADPFGDFLARTLREAGVADEYVERDPDAKTTLAFVSRVGEGSEPEFSFYRHETADARLGADGRPDGLLDGVSWVHVGGVALASEPARTATLDLMDRARERGCTVSLDPNARPELWPDRAAFADAVAAAFARADAVKATPGDLREAGIEGDSPGELTRAVTDRGPHTALLTLGGAGAHAYATDDAPWAGEAAHRGYEVDAVDTTGAGDAFTAGAIRSLAGGETDLAAVLSFANAVGALTTTDTGAMTALPTADAVRAFREE